MDLNEENITNYFDQSFIDYKQGSSRVQEHLPDAVQGYFNFTEECFKAGSMNEKQKQLIALGISIYANDEYCIMYHTKGAIDHEASEEEIIETLAVSAALGGGVAFSQGITLALDTYDHYAQSKK